MNNNLMIIVMMMCLFSGTVFGASPAKRYKKDSFNALGKRVISKAQISVSTPSSGFWNEVVFIHHHLDPVKVFNSEEGWPIGMVVRFTDSFSKHATDIIVKHVASGEILAQTTCGNGPGNNLGCSVGLKIKEETKTGIYAFYLQKKTYYSVDEKVHLLNLTRFPDLSSDDDRREMKSHEEISNNKKDISW